MTETGEYNNLPLRVEVTRPKEKYKMSLTYQSPEAVSIGKSYKEEVFVLENRWNLPEVDLDKKLEEIRSQNSAPDNNRQPEESGERCQPDKIGTPAHVHKNQNDAAHFEKRNSQRDQRVCSLEKLT